MAVEDVTLHQIRVFREVAKTRSYTSAARHMNLSQSTLSRSVSQLERTLGVTLLQRDTRNVVITAEGEEFLKVADQLIDTLTLGLERFDRYANAQLGTLALATLASFAASVLPRLLSAFFRGNEGLDFHLADGGHDDVLRLLDQGTVEVVISADVNVPQGFWVTPVLEEVFYGVAPDDHHWAGSDSLSWSDFDAEPFVAARPGTSIRSITDQALSDAAAEVRQRFEVANIATLGGLVRAGFGVSALPALEFMGYRLDDLTRVPIVGSGPRRVLAVISRPHAELSPTARRFRKIAAQGLRRMKLPAGISVLAGDS
jgi:LysR family transcriptional regulator, carnitine catabolism transcriptional activator